MEALFEMQCPRQYARQLPRASPRTFFAGLTAKRQRKAAVPSSNPCVTEVDNYLHGRSQQRTVIIIQISKHPEIVCQTKHRFASQCCRRKTFFSGWQSFHTITRQHDQRALRHACFSARVRTWLIGLIILTFMHRRVVPTLHRLF
jgi:hypothetical protein